MWALCNYRGGPKKVIYNSEPDPASKEDAAEELQARPNLKCLLTPAVHRIPHFEEIAVQEKVDSAMLRKRHAEATAAEDIIAKVAIFSMVFISHSTSAQELPKVLVAWTAVLKRRGPQEQQLGLTSAELGHKHSMSCCSAERELSDKLRDAEIAESVRKVILARFFSLQDLRTAYASCATLEHQQILCAPLLHAQLQAGAESQQMASF